MNKRKPTAGERMIESARQALAFAKGKERHGCAVHVPKHIDVKAIRIKNQTGERKLRNNRPH